MPRLSNVARPATASDGFDQVARSRRLEAPTEPSLADEVGSSLAKVANRLTSENERELCANSADWRCCRSRTRRAQEHSDRKRATVALMFLAINAVDLTTYPLVADDEVILNDPARVLATRGVFGASSVLAWCKRDCRA